MPHIHVYGIDMRRNIESISIHAEVNFSRQYFGTQKAEMKLKELQQKIEDLIEVYFEDYESDILGNHEWNVNWNESK